MGWCYSQGWRKVSDVVDYLISPDDTAEATWRTLAHHVDRKDTKGCRAVLWIVRECSDKETRESVRYIACALIDGSQGMGYGYKPLDERMGPIYYGCPLEYLEMVPEENPEWRQDVRAFHGRQTAPLFNEADCGGAFDGVRVISDADPGL